MKKRIIAGLMAVCICFSGAYSVAYIDKSTHALTIIASIKNVSVLKDVIAIGENVQIELEWTTGATQEVSYSTSDENIAIVDNTGLVTGISNGTAIITVTNLNKNTTKTISITVSSEVEKSIVYNASELSLGTKLHKYDTIHYDGENIGSVANVVNTDGGYDLESILIDDYTLPFEAEVVGLGLTIYIAPELDGVTYIDGRTLNIGDIVNKDSHLLCYDYIINERTFPVFLPKYYEQYIGKGTIRVKDINHENKTLTLEAIEDETSKNPVEDNIIGDVNADGEFTVADVVALQGWLLNLKDVTLVNWENADFSKDGRLDSFDIILMKQSLINQSTSKKITLNDIIELSQKGDDLTWSDFEEFESIDIGSGLYILKYEVSDNADIHLLIGGESTDGKPLYINLEGLGGTAVDIRHDEFKQLLKQLDFTDNEDSDENRTVAKALGEYALAELQNGTYNLETEISLNDASALMNTEMTEIYENSAFIYLEFVDEHTVLLKMDKGLLDAYGYLITDGAVTYDVESVFISNKGYDGDIVNIEWSGENLYYFSAGL